MAITMVDGKGDPPEFFQDHSVVIRPNEQFAEVHVILGWVKLNLVSTHFSRSRVPKVTRKLVLLGSDVWRFLGDLYGDTVKEK